MTDIPEEDLVSYWQQRAQTAERIRWTPKEKNRIAKLEHAISAIEYYFGFVHVHYDPNEKRLMQCHKMRAKDIIDQIRGQIWEVKKGE